MHPRSFIDARSFANALLQEVIELLSSFRDIMRRNYETLDVDKIQDRWSDKAFISVLTARRADASPCRCCGDEPWLFRERWEKLFEDFCDVEQKKFDPSRVGSFRTPKARRNRLMVFDRYRSCTILSSIAPFITASSCLPSSMSMVASRMAGRQASLRTDACTSCIAVRKRCSTWSRRRSMV